MIDAFMLLMDHVNDSSINFDMKYNGLTHALAEIRGHSCFA